MQQEKSKKSREKAQMDDRYFKRRSDAISFFVVVAHLLIVLSPVYITAATDLGLYIIFCWLFFSLSMNGILNLLHECAHYLVFSKKKGSNILGKYIIAPMVFADFEAYQKRHWDHHKFLGEEGETKDTYLIDIRGMKVLQFLLRCVLMAEAASKFFKQTQTETAKKSYAWIFNFLVFQSFFALSLLLIARIDSDEWLTALYHAVVAYGFVYLYGLMSLTVFMAALRAIAEHQQYDNYSTKQGYATLRNFRCNLVSRFLMGVYGFGEHYTHHRIPGMPYYKLKEATAEMAQEDASLRPGKDYFSVLAEIIRGRR